jgi:hypothetical protein
METTSRAAVISVATAVNGAVKGPQPQVNPTTPLHPRHKRHDGQSFRRYPHPRHHPLPTRRGFLRSWLRVRLVNQHLAYLVSSHLTTRAAPHWLFHKLTHRFASESSLGYFPGHLVRNLCWTRMECDRLSVMSLACFLAHLQEDEGGGVVWRGRIPL